MNIDYTQQLPRNCPVVNMDWIAKHSIKLKYADGIHESSSAWVKVTNGIVTQASEKDNSILNYLVTYGWIEICHMDCALSFLELRHAYNSKSNYKSNSVYLAKVIGGEAGKGDVEQAYEYIFKAIEKKGEKIILYACSSPCDMKSGCQTESANNIYRKVFEILLKSSDEIWRIIQAERLQNAIAS